MLQKMEHRSPNEMSVMPREGFSLGMGRLSIIDLVSPGLCPFEKDGFVLSFNGEIYNYLELRKELESFGIVFRTKSDTEVLLESFLVWGEKCLLHLNGMFAFAIDTGDMIFLARDIAGEKPLYYSESPFRFASEAKALNWGCKELPPASYLIYDKTKESIEIHRWWDFEPVKIHDPERELEELLEDSIRLRTKADVPYGLYLSEGVDSNLIRTFHNFEHEFTYKDGDFEKEFKEILPKILYHLDYPISSFSAFALWKLAEQASKKVKVVLSGEGADELFGGYIRYVAPHFNFQAQKKFPSYEKMFFPAEDVHTAGKREFQGNLRELLRMGDRMSSAFGIENRCPFLDRRIINFAFSLPMDWKISGLETKIILRNILKKRNPSYTEVEKHGLYVRVPEFLGEENRFSKLKYKELQEKIWLNFPKSQ